MIKQIARLLLAAGIIVGSFSSTVSAETVMDDVQKPSPYYQSAVWTLKFNIMDYGYENPSGNIYEFRPYDRVWRKDLAKALYQHNDYMYLHWKVPSDKQDEKHEEQITKLISENKVQDETISNLVSQNQELEAENKELKTQLEDLIARVQYLEDNAKMFNPRKPQ